MNKISEEDLKNIFGQNKERTIEAPKTEITSDLGVNQQVKYKKSNHKIDEVKIKKIKKQIHLIRSQTKKNDRPLTVFLWFCFYCGLAGFVIFGALNFGAFKDRLDWSYYNDYLGEKLPTILPPVVDIDKSDPLSLPDYDNPSASQQPEGLKIDKLSLQAPIIWNIEEKDILESLKSGVVHYKGTSLPGEGGNVFITGHSSNYFWVNSDYNQVFALLDKLDKSDRITISYNNKIFTYLVVDKKVVNPNQVEVLNSTKKEVLTLMTCWPIGTSLNRLVVQAELLFTSAN